MKIKTYNAEKMGQSNKKVVLNMIRFYPGISRRDLAEAVGLDPSTVTKIIRDLQKRGWVREVGLDGHFHPGRPAIKLEIVKEVAMSFVVEMTVQRICMGWGYLDNSVDNFSSFRTPQDKSVDVYFDSLAAHLDAQFEKGPLDNLVSISVAVPGLVEWGSNILRSIPRMRWSDVDLEAELRGRLPWMETRKLDILTVNEAKLGLLTEMALNKSVAGMKNGIYLYIAQGVGGALLIGDELYHGSNNIAGELGHMIVSPNGAPCYCGNKGCLETYISIDSVVKAYETRYAPLEGDFRDRFDTLMEMARAKDSQAMTILDEMADYMAIGIANLVNIYDPDFVLLGGMGSQFPDDFVESVSERVYGQLLLPLKGRLLILKGSMDVDSLTLRGATLTAMNEFVRKSFSNEGRERLS
ncbi:MAG: ROK family transcriptional regulator [Synergistaceae bacterium]|jgi:predicted NBD/HSP70 family sugar kinase|nr:ROK family transcriptional regulator [Synergistaceae bacterium]